MQRQPTTYIKWVSKNMKNKDLQLKVGLNIDNIPFNTSDGCCAGGIYYCRIEDFAYWFF